MLLVVGPIIKIATSNRQQTWRGKQRGGHHCPLRHPLPLNVLRVRRYGPLSSFDDACVNEASVFLHVYTRIPVTRILLAFPDAVNKGALRHGRAILQAA